MTRAIARNVPVVGTLTPYAAATGEPDAAIHEALRFGGALVVTDSRTMNHATAAADTRPPAFGAMPRFVGLARDARVTELRTFPGRVWAAVLYRDAKPMPVFSADPGAQQPPKVSFGS